MQFISLGGKATQIPGGRVTQTPLPGRLSLTCLGKDDGSLHPNSLKLREAGRGALPPGPPGERENENENKDKN